MVVSSRAMKEDVSQTAVHPFPKIEATPVPFEF